MHTNIMQNVCFLVENYFSKSFLYRRNLGHKHIITTLHKWMFKFICSLLYPYPSNFLNPTQKIGVVFNVWYSARSSSFEIIFNLEVVGPVCYTVLFFNPTSSWFYCSLKTMSAFVYNSVLISIIQSISFFFEFAMDWPLSTV